MNPNTLRQLLHDALTLIAKCEMFKSHAACSEGAIQDAYTTLYEQHLELLKKKIDDASVASKAS